MKGEIAKRGLTVGFTSIIALLGLANSIKAEQLPEEGIAPNSDNLSPATLPATSPAAPPEREVQHSPEVFSEPAAPTTAQGALVCPPGQFASAFSDVLPDHWAYTAVNRLANVPVECFDLPR